MAKRIGVLAVQGAFAEHITAMKLLGAECFEIRQKSDLIHDAMDGLILPGGESTVMIKLIQEQDMFDTIQQSILDGLPVFGTCAGLILLAKTIINEDNKTFNAMDITVKRNAYGRQLGSFKTTSPFANLGHIPMVFIRAPLIERVSKDIEVLAMVDKDVVAARQKNMLVTAFHPELTTDLKVHQYFLEQMA